MALFDETTPISEVTVDVLVGEGKKFKTTDDLARAKAESDRVIAARERELAELREELNKRAVAEELFNKIQTTIQPPQSAGQDTQVKPPVQSPSLTDEDLDKRIKENLARTSEEARKAQNSEEVSRRLLQEFGDEEKANEVVNRKAAELGVPVKWLEDVALTSPKAFFAQLGLEQAPKGSVPAPRSDVNTDTFRSSPQAQPGTYSYWENQRKVMSPTEYFSPRIQNQIMKEAFEAAEKGVDFFRT